MYVLINHQYGSYKRRDIGLVCVRCSLTRNIVNQGSLQLCGGQPECYQIYVCDESVKPTRAVRCVTTVLSSCQWTMNHELLGTVVLLGLVTSLCGWRWIHQGSTSVPKMIQFTTPDYPNFDHPNISFENATVLNPNVYYSTTEVSTYNLGLYVEQREACLFLLSSGLL